MLDCPRCGRSTMFGDLCHDCERELATPEPDHLDALDSIDQILAAERTTRHGCM